MFGRDRPAPTGQSPSTNTIPPVAPYSMPTPPSPQAGSAAASNKIETVIGPNCSVNGMLQSDGGVRIEGTFDGEIRTAGNLIVAESAKVIAEVQAYNVVISGSMKGNITANRIEITETGKLWGDLNVNSLLLSEGAFLRGQTNMGGDIEPPMIEAPQKTNAKLVNPNELESANA